MAAKVFWRSPAGGQQRWQSVTHCTWKTFVETRRNWTVTGPACTKALNEAEKAERRDRAGDNAGGVRVERGVRHDETIYLMSFTSNYFAVNRSVFIKFIDSTKPVIPISNHDPGNAIIPY